MNRKKISEEKFQPANSEIPLGVEESTEQLAIGPASPSTDSKALASEQIIRAYFKAGKFEKALLESKRQLESSELPPEYKAWIQDQLPVLQLGIAWQLIRSGRCEDALDSLNDLTGTSHAALALKGLGYCSLKVKDIFSARTYLHQYIALKPKDPEGYILLSEAEESLGSLDAALDITTRAQGLEFLTEEEKEDLQQREAKLSSKLEEQPSQVEISAGFFWVRYQVIDNQELVEKSLEVLQNHVHFLVQTLGFEYPKQPIEVVFHRRDNFQKMSHSPIWAAALYDGRIRIPVTTQQTLDTKFAHILRHELTHALLSEQARHQSLPPWFQEGLAQYAECEGLCRAYRFAASSSTFLDLSTFEGSFTSLPQRQANLAYTQSLYLLLSLTQGPKYYGLPGLKQIIQTLPLLETYNSNELLRQLGLDFNELHATAKQYWEQQKSF